MARKPDRRTPEEALIEELLAEVVELREENTRLRLPSALVVDLAARRTGKKK